MNIEHVAFNNTSGSYSRMNRVHTRRLYHGRFITVIRATNRRWHFIRRLTSLNSRQRQTPNPNIAPDPHDRNSRTVSTNLNDFLNVATNHCIIGRRTTVAIRHIRRFFSNTRTNSSSQRFIFSASLRVHLRTQVTIISSRIRHMEHQIFRNHRPNFSLFRPNLRTATFTLIRHERTTSRTVTTTNRRRLQVKGRRRQHSRRKRTRALFRRDKRQR